MPCPPTFRHSADALAGRPPLASGRACCHLSSEAAGGEFRVRWGRGQDCRLRDGGALRRHRSCCRACGPGHARHRRNVRKSCPGHLRHRSRALAGQGRSGSVQLNGRKQRKPAQGRHPTERVHLHETRFQDAVFRILASPSLRFCILAFPCVHGVGEGAASPQWRACKSQLVPASACGPWWASSELWWHCHC